MVTYTLGDAEVQAWLKDLLIRVGPHDVVCAVTDSGKQLMGVILGFTQNWRSQHAPWLDNATAMGVGYSKNQVVFDTSDDPQAFHGKSVLVMDATIHSGKMMGRVIEEIAKHQPRAITTYGLVVKRNSSFLPTYWGLMIDDVDRAYFLLDAIPNNRLCVQDSPQHVHVRRLDDSHATMPPLSCGVAALDRVTWGDRLFDMKESGGRRQTYLLENHQSVFGYLTVHRDGRGTLFVDEIVSATKGQGHGGILIRFAETPARHDNARRVHLRAIELELGFYKHYGYIQIPGIEPLQLDGDRYFSMEKPLLTQLAMLDDAQDPDR